MKNSIFITLTALIICVCTVLGLTGCMSQEDVNTSVNDAVSPLSEDIEAASKDITELEEKAEALESKLSEVNTQIAGLNGKSDATSASLISMKSALDSQLSAIRDEITALKAKDTAIEEKNNQISVSITSLSERLATAEATINALSTAVEAITNQSNKNAEDIAALLQQIESLKNTDKDTQTQLDHLLRGNHNYDVYTDNKDGTHNKTCSECGNTVNNEKHSYTITESSSGYYSFTASCPCGDTHNLGERCYCYQCDKSFHQLDENCVCLTCGEANHTVSAATGICQVCNKLAAQASITLSGTTTYYAIIDEAIAAAEEIDNCTIVLENNAQYRNTIKLVTKGNFTIDLNGKEFSSYGNYSLRVQGANLTIKDSKGGGKFIEYFGAFGGTVTIESGELAGGILCSSTGILNIKGGKVSSVSINEKTATLKLSGGSMGKVSSYKDFYTPAQLLVEGYCYYDSNGNAIDTSTLQPDGYWYTLTNVTVAPIK